MRVSAVACIAASVAVAVSLRHAWSEGKSEVKVGSEAKSEVQSAKLSLVYHHTKRAAKRKEDMIENASNNEPMVSESFCIQIVYTNPRICHLYHYHPTFSSSDHLASVEIVDRVAVGIEDTEAWRLVVILVRVPEDVNLVEGLAGDGSPESLSVLDGSNLFDN